MTLVKEEADKIAQSIKIIELEAENQKLKADVEILELFCKRDIDDTYADIKTINLLYETKDRLTEREAFIEFIKTRDKEILDLLNNIVSTAYHWQSPIDDLVACGVWAERAIDKITK